MAVRIPKLRISTKIDWVTRLIGTGAIAGIILSVTALIVFLNQPDRIHEPAKLWIIPAVTAFYIAGTIWSYKMDKAEAAKVKVTKCQSNKIKLFRRKPM